MKRRAWVVQRAAVAGVQVFLRRMSPAGQSSCWVYIRIMRGGACAGVDRRTASSKVSQHLAYSSRSSGRSSVCIVKTARRLVAGTMRLGTVTALFALRPPVGPAKCTDVVDSPQI